MKFRPPVFSAAEMSSSIPVLDEGTYAGILHTSVEEKSGDSYIPSIRLKPVTKREGGETIQTGEWELSGTLAYRVELLSKKAKNLLKQDKPQIFARPVKLIFNQENGKFELSFNPVIKLLTETFLSDQGNVFADLNEQIWERYKDEEFDLPEELENVPNAQLLYEMGIFYDALFREWVLMLTGQKVRAMVIKVHPQTNVGGKYITDKTTYVNQLNQGTAWPIAKTGLLPYIERSEFDDEDE